MQQKELKKLVDDGMLESVLVVDKSLHWEVCAFDRGGDFSVIRTARGGKREFKTLDAARKMLEEASVKSFTVC